MKVAFIHDWLTGMRGGEKVLETACEIFPAADIYTLIHNPKRISATINQRRIMTSWLQYLPGIHRYYRYLLPLMPYAIRAFDLSGYDLVLSFSHCVAKGIRLRPREGRGRRPLHICYCFTPMRYIYSQFENYFSGGSRPWLKRAATWLRPLLTAWDRDTTRDVQHLLAISENIRRRIQETYGRDAPVIYPPADTDFFRLPDAPRERAGNSYYLVVGALVPYKRVDLAIEACRELNLPLKIVGIGTEKARLKRLARGAPIEFLGWQSPEALRDLYQGCEALLFPQEEDFGIAAIEAMACGAPVIAYKGGGALETVEEGKSGVFFEPQTASALARAIQRARSSRFDPSLIRARAQCFDRDIFKSRFREFIQAAWEEKAAPTRVLQVIECAGPGGTGNQVAAICNGLDKSRFEVSLAYAVRPGGSPRDYEALACGAARFFHLPEMVREITPLLDLRAGWRLYRLLRAERPDIVHAHSSKAGFLARVAAWAAGVPRIYYSPRGYSFLQQDRSPLARRFYLWLERSVSWIGEVVAVSESEARLARESAWARSARVVRDACLGDVPRKNGRAEPASAPLVCSLGRLSYPRHPEAFLRLAKRLLDARPGLRCLWIGGGELEPAARALIRDLGIGDRLEMSGWLPHAEALRRLREADVVVHYSRWEGLPNAVLEAMALGKPVVASDLPANRELVRHGESGFLAADETELFERTTRLLEDPALRGSMGEAGRRIVAEQYSRDRLLRELSALYDGVPDERAAAALKR